MSERGDIGIVDEAIVRLGEHFDTVMIFVTRHESGERDGTVNIAKGAGNWYARFGQVSEWKTKEIERARMDVRKDNGV